jgi:hypothetical protein
VEHEKPNQTHYEMTPFVIFNSKEIKISKHRQQAHETTKQHYCDIKKGNVNLTTLEYLRFYRKDFDILE